jgi:1-deoxy-D-xylulose-5-phosphate reductoisomerase
MSNSFPQRRIAVFGSTGSIGCQALEVIAANPDKFSAEILTAQSNDELLVKQALKFNPNIVVIGDERRYPFVKEALSRTDIKVFAGDKALDEVLVLPACGLLCVHWMPVRPLPWPTKKPW